MGWWGKLVGGAFGFMLGGPLGALLGGVLGHNFDRGLGRLSESQQFRLGDQERVQTAFFTTTFSVMGHLAKADGQVSRQEIALAEAVMAQMDLNADLRRAAIRLFDQGKGRDFPLVQVLEQFRRECRRRTSLVQMFLEIQIQAAYADGVMDAAEEAMLLTICRHLGVPEFIFRRLQSMIEAGRGFHGGPGGGPAPMGPSLDDAYSLLGVSPQAAPEEIKRAYRRLRSQHHPDKLVAKGLPEEMTKLAEKKFHEIRQAYETIRKARGF